MNIPQAVKRAMPDTKREALTIFENIDYSWHLRSLNESFICLAEGGVV